MRPQCMHMGIDHVAPNLVDESRRRRHAHGAGHMGRTALQPGRQTGETGIFVRHPFHHVAAQAQGHQALERGALSHQGADTHGAIHFVA